MEKSLLELYYGYIMTGASDRIGYNSSLDIIERLGDVIMNKKHSFLNGWIKMLALALSLFFTLNINVVAESTEIPYINNEIQFDMSLGEVTNSLNALGIEFEATKEESIWTKLKQPEGNEITVQYFFSDRKLCQIKIDVGNEENTDSGYSKVKEAFCQLFGNPFSSMKDSNLLSLSCVYPVDVNISGEEDRVETDNGAVGVRQTIDACQYLLSYGERLVLISVEEKSIVLYFTIGGRMVEGYREVYPSVLVTLLSEEDSEIAKKSGVTISGIYAQIALKPESEKIQEKTECEKCEGNGYFSCNFCTQEDFVLKCLDCGWTGNYLHSCAVCSGQGKLKCVECSGKGVIRCESCSSTGKQYCPRCNGSGCLNLGSASTKKDQTWAKTTEDTIAILNGVDDPSFYSDRGECPNCRGTGRIKCDRCSGSGTVGCPSCHRDGYKICPSCLGKGTIPSYSCDLNENHRNVVCIYCKSSNHQYACPFCTGDPCIEFIYQTIMRNPEEYIGKNVCVAGIVQDIHDKGKGTYSIGLLNQEENISRNYDILYVKPEDGLRVLKGDNISAYGTFVSYDSDGIPLIAAYYAELKEK